MRCLYCGKELALLKRLRGGGEFCSEAHRKEYQEQYEQLALARLLQAKPAEAGKLPSQSPLRAPETPAAKQVANPAPPPREPGAPEIPTVAAVRSVAMIEAPNEPPPSRSTPNEEPAPLAGFLQEAAAVAVHPSPRSATLEFRTVKTTPNLPAAMAGCRETDSMPPAEAVEFGFSLQALEEHTRTSDRGVESREFAGPDPQVNLHLQPSTGPGPAGKADPMEISMSPHPPQKANPW